MRGRAAIWLACVCASVLGGCSHHPHSQVLKILWVDFNIYDRPAIFYDEKSHYPSKSQHVQYYRWRHQPDRDDSFIALPATTLPPASPVEKRLFAPAPTNPSDTQNESDELAPSPDPGPRAQPREEAPPPAPVDPKPQRYTSPNGPTAARSDTTATQPTSFKQTSGVPVKSLLFAHP